MINSSNRWAQYYSKRIDKDKKYPSEWIVRTLKGTNYPDLKLDKTGYIGANILDLSCGDGRNLGLLQDLGFSVHATEVSDKIVALLEDIKPDMGWDTTFKCGINTDLPYDDLFFDYILSCWSFYYMQEDTDFGDILQEITRVICKDGFFIATIPDSNNSILRGAKRLMDGSMIIKNDPLGIRNGVRWMVADSAEDLNRLLNPYFKDIRIGHLNDNYFGLVVSGFIFVCRKR